MSTENEQEWKGWPHWIEQELAKTPDDEVLLVMKEMMNYQPEPDFSLDKDQIRLRH